MTVLASSSLLASSDQWLASGYQSVVSASVVGFASPGAALQVQQTQSATVVGYGLSGVAIDVSLVLLATLVAGSDPQAQVVAAQTLAVQIAASPDPQALLQVLQSQTATVIGFANPGVAISAQQTNYVFAQVLGFALPGASISAFQNYSEAAALFAAIQAAIPAFYRGVRPAPASSTYFLQSGTWTVPQGTNFYVSATAAGGTPLGAAGRQMLGQSLAVAPGDVLQVSIGPNVLIARDGTTLVSLLDGHAYAKGTAGGLPQSSGIVGLGSGVDSGPAYPACVVFFWR